MTDPTPVFVFDVPEDVLDRLDDIDAVELEDGWQDRPSNALLAAVARLDETMADHCEELGFKGDLSETMDKLVYEMWRRKDQRRYRAARIGLEVMEAARRFVAQATGPFN